MILAFDESSIRIKKKPYFFQIQNGPNGRGRIAAYSNIMRRTGLRLYIMRKERGNKNQTEHVQFVEKGSRKTVVLLLLHNNIFC